MYYMCVIQRYIPPNDVPRGRQTFVHMLYHARLFGYMGRDWPMLYNVPKRNVLLFSTSIPNGHRNLFCNRRCPFCVYNESDHFQNQNAAISSSWCD
jgi:sulfatase maturation enzyme AslB (radical SAM superfamily)